MTASEFRCRAALHKIARLPTDEGKIDGAAVQQIATEALTYQTPEGEEGTKKERDREMERAGFTKVSSVGEITIFRFDGMDGTDGGASKAASPTRPENGDTNR